MTSTWEYVVYLFFYVIKKSVLGVYHQSHTGKITDHYDRYWLGSNFLTFLKKAMVYVLTESF